MENNVENTDRAIGWLEKLLELARKYKALEWIEAFLILFVAGCMMFCFTNPSKVINFFQKSVKEAHQELLTERMMKNVEIQKITDRLLYSTEGSLRCVLVECHNSQYNSSTGLPFAKISATYESLQEGVFPVSGQYRDINLSLLPFASYLSDSHYYFGDSLSIRAIDKSFAYRLKANGVEHFAAISIPGRKGTIGFLILTFNDITDLDTERLRNNLEQASIRLAILLETNNS